MLANTFFTLRFQVDMGAFYRLLGLVIATYSSVQLKAMMSSAASRA
jgi:hypothetical protein